MPKAVTVKNEKKLKVYLHKQTKVNDTKPNNRPDKKNKSCT